MKIIYSKFEQDNIKKEKSNVKSYVPGAFKEHLKLSLVKIPFIIVFLGFALLLIYSHPFWDNFIIVGAKEGDIRDGSIGIEQFGNLCIYVLLFASSCFVVYSSLMECVHYIISHINTPCIQKENDNQKKLKELNKIDKLLDLQNEIKSYVILDEAVFVFNEDEGTLEITVNNNDCYIKKTFHINDELKKSVQEKGVLDFSYLDSYEITADNED